MTVLLEDTAALLSLLVAAAGITLARVTVNALWDALASGLIGLMLVAVAVLLAFENHALLIGQAAPPRLEAQIREVVARGGDTSARLIVIEPSGPDRDAFGRAA